MRLFQNSGLYPTYLARLDRLAHDAAYFQERLAIFLNDRFGALHFLKPVLDGDPDAFFTNGDDVILQRMWAKENGLASDASLETILLAQIEHHRTEVFYNLDPVRYPSAFVRKLPGCVRVSLCWRAAPSGNADLTKYNAVLGNFPSILETWRAKGCRAELFYPAIDPVMKDYGSADRPIDVLFVGGYSRHHANRARILEAVAGLADSYQVIYHLDASRLTKLAESAVGRFLPLAKHRRPRSIATIAQSPIFGRELYDAIGKSKIVLNGAIDMAGSDRGNMRCFEAMGCGALLVSDAGIYPEGMVDDVTMKTYSDPSGAFNLVQQSLQCSNSSSSVAAAGYSIISSHYRKETQWINFLRLCEAM